jgi:hypothetical protein
VNPPFCSKKLKNYFEGGLAQLANLYLKNFFKFFPYDSSFIYQLAFFKLWKSVQNSANFSGYFGWWD